MTALERIREIEVRPPLVFGGMLPRYWCDDNLRLDMTLIAKDYEFLIKAFKVMRKIAVEYKIQAGHRMGHETQDVNVDKEFELSMSMKEEQND